MNWKTLGCAALLSAASAAGASPLFDGTGANVWVLDAAGDTRSYGLGDWSTAVNVAGGLAQVAVEGGGNRSLAVGGSTSSILVNQTAQSLPLLAPQQIPLALAGLARGSGDPAQGNALPAVQVQPAGGRFDGTVAVVLRATRAEGVSSTPSLRWRINGGAQQSRSFGAGADAEARFFLAENGVHRIEATAVQAGKTSPAASVQIEIAGADPLRDSDGDGIPDLVELALGMDPLGHDIGRDSDGDGWPDFEERLRGSDPNDPNSKPLDSDHDGWSDFDERLRGTNPNDDFSDIAGNPLPVLYPDRPVARRLYEVEARVSGDLLCALKPDRRRENLTGLTAIALGGSELYDVSLLPDVAQLEDQPKPQKENQLPAHLRRSAAQDALTRGRLPSLRLPVGEALVLRATDEGQYRLKRVLPSYADPTPGEVTAWLAAQQRSWTTAQQWIDAYVEYLAAHVVQRDVAGISLQDGAGSALLESVLSWQAPVEAGVSLIGVPRQPASPEAVQRLTQALQRNGAGIGVLAARIAALPELAATRGDIAAALSCDASEAIDAERAAYDKATALPVSVQYLSRILVLEDLQALAAAPRTSLVNPAADTDGDGLSNVGELTPRDFRDPRVADGAAALPSLTASDLRVREPQLGSVYLPVVLRLSAPSASVVRVSYATRDGIAVGMRDYVAANGVLEIPPGVLEAQFNLEVLADGDAEEEEAFTVRLSNAENASLSRTSIKIAIEDAAAAQRTPLARDDSSSVAPEASVDIDVLANDDGRGASLLVNLHTLPAVGTAQVLGNGRIRYTAARGFVGSTAFQYRAENGDGLWALATVTVSSTEQPNTPPVAVDDAVMTPSGTTVDIAVLVNDRDAENDPLIVSLVRQPQHGTALVLGSGSIRYIPGASYGGEDSLRYRIDDGRGGSAEAEVRITVEPPLSELSIADVTVTEAVSGTANATLMVRLSLAADKTVTVGWRTLDGTALADVDYVKAAGTVSFAPGQTQRSIVVAVLADTLNEPDEQFRVELSGAVNASIARGLAMVTIKDGTPVNRAPVALDDTALVAQGDSVTIDVLANDSDADGDALKVTLSTPPGKGSAQVLSDQRIRYDAPADFSGEVTLGYTVSDGRGGSASAVVTLTVGAGLQGFAIYRQQHYDGQTYISHLYRVALNAPERAQRLTPDFPTEDPGVQGYWISPNGRYLLYSAYAPGSYDSRLFIVDLDANPATVRPFSPLPVAGTTLGFDDPVFAGDGTTVIYRLRLDPQDFRYAMVATPLTKPETMKVLVAADVAEVRQAVPSADGLHVYLLANGGQAENYANYVAQVRIDGSTPVQAISELIPSFEMLQQLELTNDGRWLIFRRGNGSFDPGAALYTIDTQAPGVAQRLTPDYSASGAMGLSFGSYRVAPDSSRVLFVANAGEKLANGDDAQDELYSVPLQPPFVTTRVSALAPQGISEIAITPDSRHVGYIEQQFGEQTERYLRAVALTTPGVAAMLAGPLRYLDSLQPIPGGAGFDARGFIDGIGNVVQRALLDGSAARDFGGSGGGDVESGGVNAYAALRDGRHLLYISDRRLRGVAELFRIDTGKTDSEVLLSAPLDAGVGSILDLKIYQADGGEQYAEREFQ